MGKGCLLNSLTRLLGYCIKDSLFQRLLNLSYPLQDKLSIALQKPKRKILAILCLKLASSVYCYSYNRNLNRGILTKVLTLVRILYRDLIKSAKRYNGRRECFKLKVKGVGKRTDGIVGKRKEIYQIFVLTFSPNYIGM